MHSHHTHRHRLRKPVTCCGQWAGMDLNSDDVSPRPHLQQTEARKQAIYLLFYVTYLKLQNVMCLINRSNDKIIIENSSQG